MKMIHAIKIQPPYFDDVISGKKQFEIRLNDREYQEGDYLALNEWEQTSSVGGHYTGRSCLVYVDYILYGAKLGIGLDEDYCIMGIKPCGVYNRQDGICEHMVSPPNWNKPMLLENPIIQEGECNANDIKTKI
ncbi:MAG: DUF3850 domain-containing protein [Clostridia bacterium]|nr:DUF3850 domain-containing protein [Clostridia bacterium]